jgi:hypothetical protein
MENNAHVIRTEVLYRLSAGNVRPQMLNTVEKSAMVDLLMDGAAYWSPTKKVYMLCDERFRHDDHFVAG